MHVQLDDELWEMSDSVRLEDVLARITDKAQEGGRLVTRLTVGDREFTDRDLLPNVLSQPAGTFGAVKAQSQSLQAIVEGGAHSAKRYGASLRAEAAEFLRGLRRGEPRFRQIDAWLGRLADYVEWAELARSVGARQAPGESLSAWVKEFLQARESHDTVRLADILEFEILPALPREPS